MADFSEVPQGANFAEGAQVFSPPWLMDPVGAPLMVAQSSMWDALAEFTRYGVISRFPTIAQPDCLAELGKDRIIFRGLSETDDHYAERLRVFKRTWKFAGNAPTLLRQAWELMAPDATRIRYVCNGYNGETANAGSQFTDWWTIDGSGLSFQRVEPSNWNWDNAFGYNVRFWIIVYREDLSPARWGVPPYAWGEPDLRWGAAPGSSRNWVSDAYNIVDTFKASGSHMGPFPLYDGGLIIANPSFTTSPWGTNGPFDPNHAPGYPMPDGSFDSANARPPGAVYLSGL